MTELELFQRLGLALALGLLIGFERGWHERAGPEGSRIAGIRTFALVGFGGGLAALLLGTYDSVAFGLAFAAVATLIIAAHVASLPRIGSLGVTTGIATLVTFLLGAAAVRGEPLIAAAGAVVTTILLSLKPVLHRWLQNIEQQELLAVLKLLLISVVILPVLPDRGMGPWAAINPYEIWWLVVLIAGVSFAGYVAVRLFGAGHGVMLTGLLGGITSSTAVTLSLARLSRHNPEASRLLAAGATAASAMMLPRLLLVVGLLNPALALQLAWPLGAAAVTSFAGAFWLWRGAANDAAEPALKLDNPFEFWVALRFGLLLAIIMLLARAVPAWFGAEGLYALAAISGLADVDAISVSMARLAGGEIAPELAAAAVGIAALTNTLAKVLYTFIAGHRAAALRVAAVLLLSAVAGVAAFLLGVPVPG